MSQMRSQMQGRQPVQTSRPVQSPRPAQTSQTTTPSTAQAQTATRTQTATPPQASQPHLQLRSQPASGSSSVPAADAELPLAFDAADVFDDAESTQGIADAAGTGTQRKLDAAQIALLEQQSESLPSRIIGSLLTLSMVLSMILTPFAFFYTLQPELVNSILELPFQLIAPISLIYITIMTIAGIRIAAIFGCGPWYKLTARPID